MKITVYRVNGGAHFEAHLVTDDDGFDSSVIVGDGLTFDAACEEALATASKIPEMVKAAQGRERKRAKKYDKKVSP